MQLCYKCSILKLKSKKKSQWDSQVLNKKRLFNMVHKSHFRKMEERKLKANC